MLLEATGEGHCALPVELLKDEAGKLLLVDEKIVTAGAGAHPGQRGLGAGEHRRTGTDLPAVPQAGGGSHRRPHQEAVRVAGQLPAD